MAPVTQDLAIMILGKRAAEEMTLKTRARNIISRFKGKNFPKTFFSHLSADRATIEVDQYFGLRLTFKKFGPIRCGPSGVNVRHRFVTDREADNRETCSEISICIKL